MSLHFISCSLAWALFTPAPFIMKNNLLRLLIAIVLGCLIALPTNTVAQTNPTTIKSPDWLRNGVLYEIFTRNFSPSGDFKGITARLDELKKLGVDILWLMPIHPQGELKKKGSAGSPYCVRDFYGINPDYGTKDDFKRLVTEAHARGFKVILDVVTAHTSWDSVLMSKPDFYSKDADGKIHSPYPEWTDVAELDYGNPEVRRYMTDVLAYWVREFDVDGFRCDTAYTVPVEFWESARAELKKIKDQVVIITDSGAKPLLLSKAFDMDYGGNLVETVNKVMAGQQPASLISDSWTHTDEQFSGSGLHLRFSDYHNLPRANVRFGQAGALAVQVLMLTLDGVPLIYNGMEVGDATESADPALFEKMPIFWRAGGRPPLREIYRDLIQLRKNSPAFTNSDVVWLDNSAPAEVVSFIRRDGKEEFLVTINLSSRRVSVSVDVPGGGDFAPMKLTGSSKALEFAPPNFRLDGYGWTICRRRVK